MGRPSVYTREIADAICARLAAGESLRSICRDEDMPAEAAVRQWALDDREGFYAQYTRSRDIGLDVLADETLEISDDGRNDWVAKADPENPGYQYNGEAVGRSRLRVDTRKWYLSKLAPKRYGEKFAAEVTGKDGAPLGDTDAAAKLAGLLALAQARKAADDSAGDR